MRFIGPTWRDFFDLQAREKRRVRQERTGRMLPILVIAVLVLIVVLFM